MADAAAGPPPCPRPAATFAEDPAYSALLSRLRAALALPYASAVLVTSPPGGGKSALAARAAAATGRPVLPLPHALLTSSIAGDVEPAVDAFFARLAAAAPATVLLDDADAAAPAAAAAPADLRALAALHAAFDEFALDPDGSAGIVVLATASYPRDLHPSLLRAGRFGDVIALGAPGWARRRAVLASAAAADGCTGGSGVDSLHDDIASLTPGFLPADLVSLIAAAELAARREAPQRQPLAKHMLDVVASVRPTLLTSAGTSWRPIPWRPGATDELRGLAPQIRTLAGCMRASFRDPRTAARESGPARALDALGAVAGVVLHGPPGSGKTSLAWAASSLVRRGAVNAFRLDSAEIVGAVVGAAEQKLRALFALARSAAPTVLVLENIEVLAPSRGTQQGDDNEPSNSATAAFQRLLSTFLIELDGVARSAGGTSENILLVATSGDISRVDPALLRPGRLEVHIELVYPDETARAELFDAFCSRSAPHLRDAGWLRALARETEGWSAVDVHGACTEAVMRRVREAGGHRLGAGAIALERRHVEDALQSFKCPSLYTEDPLARRHR
jgi:transitional endoplasmic reticulum ATPase